MFGQFELHGIASLLLPNGRSIDGLASWSYILHLDTDDGATLQFAVDSEIEKRQVFAVLLHEIAGCLFISPEGNQTCITGRALLTFGRNVRLG